MAFLSNKRCFNQHFLRCDVGANFLRARVMGMTIVIVVMTAILNLIPQYVLAQDYVIASGDRIEVQVYGEHDLSGIYRVDDSGVITMPLIGKISAKGVRVETIQRSIGEKLSDGFLVNPNVIVQISSSRPIYVMGEVRTPGGYDYSVDMSVRHAVALSGGFTYRANQRVVSVLRDDGSGNTQTLDLGPDDRIMPGDTITVRERFF